MNLDELTRLVAHQPWVAYREFQYRPDGDIARRIDEHFQVVARPGQAPSLILQAGDMALLVSLGQPGVGRWVAVDDPALDPLRRRGRALHGQLLLRPRSPVGPDEEDDPKVAPHVAAARALWAKLFGPDNVLSKVTILDLAHVPSQAVRAEGYGAWTNSATRIYLAPIANRDSITLETTLRHEATHVRQFARGGKPDSYVKMITYEHEAYEEQWRRLDALAKDPAARRGRSKAQDKQLEQLLAVTRVQLDALEGEIARVTKAAGRQAESSYRAFLLKGFLPAHRRLSDLYEPPKPLRNPAAQESEEQAPPNRFRTVFYDRDSLRYLDGWTRATGPAAVYLIDRSSYDPIRADGTRRARDHDLYLAQTLAAAARGQKRDLMPPMFVLDPKLATVPLHRASRGDWDDRMIAQLMGSGIRLKVQSETDQWTMINRLFTQAKQDARDAMQRGRPACEFVAYFVLDIVDATLEMVPAANVTMKEGHAVIPLGQIRGTDRRVRPNGDASQRVIGNVHTHFLLDPLIDLGHTTTGTTIRFRQSSLHAGVSEVDVASARDDRIVVYAVDSRYLHRGNPDGTKSDKLPRAGNVLRHALQIFGGEPA